MAIDNKYGKVTLEKGNIGEDEPVFVFRARDLLAPSTLWYYLELCTDNGSPEGHLKAIRQAINQFEQWQVDPENYTQIPQGRMD